MYRFLPIFLLTWLFAILLSCTVHAEDEPVPPSNTVNTDDEMICHSGKPCYPKIFVPTTTFKTVEFDQIIPTGLHIRMNVGTGGKEAKLIDPNEKGGEVVNIKKDSDEIVVPGEGGQEKKQAEGGLMEVPQLEIQQEEEVDIYNLKDNNGTVISGSVAGTGTENIVEEEEEGVQVGPAPEPLKFTMQAPTDNWTVIKQAVEILGHPETTEAGFKDAFEVLADASHETEFGEYVMGDKNALMRILSLLPDRNVPEQIRWNAAITLGNALQNNKQAMDKVYETFGKENLGPFMFKRLLIALKGSQDEIMYLRRLLYAISRSVRIQGGLDAFIAEGGLDVFRETYANSEDYGLRGKIATFIQDEFLDDLMKDESHPDYGKGSTGGKVQKVMNTEVDSPGSSWCKVFQDDLLARKPVSDRWNPENPRYDGEFPPEVEIRIALGSMSATLKTLSALKEKYGDKCEAAEGFQGWLDEHSEKATDTKEDWIKVDLDAVNDAFFKTASA